jgi:hypothetical protein
MDLGAWRERPSRGVGLVVLRRRRHGCQSKRGEYGGEDSDWKGALEVCHGEAS